MEHLVPAKSTLSPIASAPGRFSSSNDHSHSGYSSSSIASTFGFAFVYPKPLSSLPPGTELRGLVGVFPSFVLVDPGVFAVEVEGVCGSDRGCDIPDVFED